MFPNLEFVKTVLNGIVDRFSRVEQYYRDVKNEVTDVKNNKIDKKQSAVNAGKYLVIGEDGVVKPNNIDVPERHVVLLSYNSSTKKYTVNQSYSTMKQWVDSGDTVVLSLNGTIYNLCEQVEGDRLVFTHVRAYSDTKVKIYTVDVYTTDYVSFEPAPGYMMPNNNDQRNKGLIPVATRNYRYELTDLSNVVIKSSTDGSTKKFKLSVDDNGTIKTINTDDSTEVQFAKTSDIAEAEQHARVAQECAQAMAGTFDFTGYLRYQIVNAAPETYDEGVLYIVTTA